MKDLNQYIKILLFFIMGLFCTGFIWSDVSVYMVMALVALLILLLFFGYQRLGLYLIAFLFPFTYWELIYKDFNVPYVDLIALLLFCAWLIKSLYLFTQKDQKWSLRNFPGLILMIFFIFTCILSLSNVEQEQLYLAIKYIFRPILFFYLMYIVLPFNLINSFKTLFNIFKIMYVLGLGLVGMGIWALIFPPIIGLRRALPVAIWGAYPLGTNHNLLAEIFIILIPFGLILFWQERNIFWKNIYLIGILLMTSIHLLTLSRSGWLALAAQLLILFFFKYKKEITKILSPLVLYLVLILIVPAALLMSQLIAAGITTSATINRLKLIEVSLMLYRQHPIIGSGIGVFTVIMSQVKWYIIEYGEVLDAHGFVFKTLAETGLLGTLAFILLIGYYLYIIYKAYLQSQKTPYETLIMGCMLAVAGTVIFQLFGTNYYLAKMWLPFGLALASLKLCHLKTTLKDNL